MRNRVVASWIVSAVLLSASVASAQAPAPVAQPSTTAIKKASVHFERGVRLFGDADFKLALVEFQRSYEAAPDFRTLYNIGQVHFQLGDFAEARRMLSRYLEEGRTKIPDARRKEVEKTLEALKIRTALLGIRVDVAGAAISIDGQQVGTAPIADRLLVSAGPHTISVTKSGFVTKTMDLALAGTEERDIELHLEPVPMQEVQVSTSGMGPVWIGWGVTAALAAGTAGMGVAWENADSSLAEAKTRPTSKSELEEKVKAIETRQTLTLVLGGATLLAAGISTVFTLARSGSLRPATEPEPAKPRLAVSPFGVAGTF